MKKIAPNFLLCPLFLIWMLFIMGETSQAKLMEPESLMYQILEGNQKVYQFYMVIRVSVFDPEEFAPLDEDIEENWIPFELSNKSYLQKIIWVRDEFCFIELTDLSDNPLQIYAWEFGDRHISHKLQPERFFEREDINNPYLMFFSKYLPFLKSELHKLGVAPEKVGLQQLNNQNVYALGSGKEKLLVDQESYHVLEIHRLIQIWGRDYPYVLKFMNWDTTKGRIPMRSKMFIGGRLFKDMKVEEITFYSLRSRIDAFLKQYQSYFPNSADFDLATAYGN